MNRLSTLAGISGITCVLAGPVLATEARFQTMQSPLGLEDEVQVFNFPGLVNDYQIASIDLGTSGNTKAYAGVLKSTSFGTVGGYVSRDDSLMTASALGSGSVMDDYLGKAASNTDAQASIPKPERVLDLFYGTKLDAKSGLGFGVTTAGYKKKQSTTEGASTTVDRDASQLDIAAGYSSTNNGSHLDLSLRVGLLGSLTSTAQTPAVKTENSFKRDPSIHVKGRTVMGSGLGMSPYVGGDLWQRAGTAKLDDGTTSRSGKFNDTALIIEGGGIYVPRVGTTIALGLGIGYLTSKGPWIKDGTGVGGTAVANSLAANEELTAMSTTALFTGLGLETGVWDSFGLLGGTQFTLAGSRSVTHNWDTAAGKPKTETSIDEVPDASLWSLGMYYKVERFRADATYSKSFLHNGPTLISGEKTSPLLARISASYLL